MPSQGSSQTGKRGAASMLGVKLQRTSYSRKDPDSLQRLRKAVEDWDDKSGPLFNASGEWHGVANERLCRERRHSVSTLQHSPHGSATVISEYLVSV